MAAAMGAAISAALAPILERFAPQERINADELQKKIMNELRGVGRPSPPAETVERCVSEDTGASFDLWIEGGLVKELRNYVPAPGYDVSVEAGGRVPKGMKVDPDDKVGYAKWLSDEWRTDIRRYVGRAPFPSMLREARERTASV